MGGNLGEKLCIRIYLANMKMRINMSEHFYAVREFATQSITNECDDCREVLRLN